jgi:4a-hydroxytetrahydrobiopterin dehydratase
MPALSRSESRRLAARLRHWTLRGRTIRRTFVLRDFAGAMKFVGRVARDAERRGHHPDIDIRWKKVTLVLSTHSEGGLTRKDFASARACNGLFRRA